MALLIRDLLAPLPQGMRVKKLMEVLAGKHGLDLEAFSQDRGYKDVVSFLGDVPGLAVRETEKGDNWLVQLWRGVGVKSPILKLPPDPALPLAWDSSTPPPDAADAPSPPADVEPMEAPGQAPGLAEVSASVREVLGRFPLGLKVGKLKVALQREHGLDLEVLSRQQGCGDALGLLRGLPHFWLQDPGKGDTCLAWLGTDAAVSPTAPARRKKRRCLVADVGTMARLIRDLLAPLPQGMRVKKLTEALARKHGVNLEAFSQARGYGDVVSFLRDVPGLSLQAPKKGKNCLVRLWTDVAEVLKLLKRLLRTYTSGLRLKKVQEFLLERHGLDLKAFVNSQGYEDVVGFLQSRLPGLEYRRPEKGEKCIIRLGTGQKGSSGSLPPDGAQPLPGSKRCPLPTNAAKRPAPPASSCLNPRLPSALTNQPLLPGLPSGQEPLSAPAILGKLGKSPGATPCLPPWLLSPPQPTGARSGLQVDDETQESGARCASIPLVLRAEEGTQQSGAQLGSVPLNPRAGSPEAPASRSPEDLTELKRKVGDILAGHPGGMSLFQLRAAYSASHQHPLPLGHTASTRQRLAQMPDVVRIQGYGVQTLLLPVAPDEPPGAEPGLAWWIPQEAAGLAGDPDAPAGAPPAPTGPDLGGDPNVLAEPPPAPAELPPTPAGPDLGGDMNALARPPPAPAEPPPTSTGPALGGDPHTLVEPPPAPAELPPTPAGPALGGDPDIPAELPPAPAEPPPSPQVLSCLGT
ncbi:uncharacterized protein [Emydura macquarii macquarii]|uniref:uncharacterized protein n=1 Tax=Emydura macquarii macquarii TaxID=1129001 RepID=UPI003529FED6